MREFDFEDLARQVYPIIRPVAGKPGATITCSEVTVLAEAVARDWGEAA